MNSCNCIYRDTKVVLYKDSQLQPSSSFVETPRSPLNFEVASCGPIFSLPTLTRGKWGNVSTIIVSKVVGIHIDLVSILIVHYVI